MSTTASLFESSIQVTDQWLTELMRELHWSDRHKALIGLRATLHATRERLPVDECAQLTAQLPLILKGLYWEGWDPHARIQAKHKVEFLDRVHGAFQHDRQVDPEAVVRAVFKVMAHHISAGEFEDIRGMFPHDLAELLPQPAAV